MAPPVGKCEIFVRANVAYKCNSDFWPCFSFVEGQVGLSHAREKWLKGERLLPASSYRTGLRDNNCPRALKFLACSLDMARAFHIERNRVCKTVK